MVALMQSTPSEAAAPAHTQPAVSASAPNHCGCRDTQCATRCTVLSRPFTAACWVLPRCTVALVVCVVCFKPSASALSGGGRGVGAYVDGGGLAWLCSGGTTLKHLSDGHTSLQCRITHIHAKAKVLD
jgi:hypothetical protein